MPETLSIDPHQYVILLVLVVVALLLILGRTVYHIYQAYIKQDPYSSAHYSTLMQPLHPIHPKTVITSAIIDMIRLHHFSNQTLQSSSQNIDTKAICALEHADLLIGELANDSPLKQAQHAMNNGQVDMAITLFTSFIEQLQITALHTLSDQQKYEYALAYLYLGAYFWLIHQPEKAIEYYLQSVVFDPNNPEGYYRLAELFDLAGSSETALHYTQKAIEIGTQQQQSKISHITKANLDYLYNQRDILKKRIESS